MTTLAMIGLVALSGAHSRGRSSIPQFVLAILAIMVANLPWIAGLLPWSSSQALSWLEAVNHPTVALIGNTVVVFLLIWGLRRLIAGGDPRKRMARSLERRHDFRGAAELFAQAGDQRRALTLFSKAREWTRAAEAARHLGLDIEAARLLRRAGGRNLDEASTLYRRAGDKSSAQRCDQHLAEWFMREGHYDEAIGAWLRAGEPLRATRAAGIALNERRLLPSNPAFRFAVRAAEDTRDFSILARLHEAESRWSAAARAWRAAGEHSRAAENYRRAGRLDEAAESEKTAGRPKESLQLRMARLRQQREQLRNYQTQGRLKTPEAIRLNEQIERETTQLLPRLRELEMDSETIELLSSSGRAEEAIQHLVDTGEAAAAAELAQNAQLWDVAAPLLEQLQRWGEASDVHELAGTLDRAALCAERSGEDERALQLYRTLAMSKEAAHCLARLGFLEEALTELHRAGLIDEACEALRTYPGPVPDIPDVVLDMAQWCHENDQPEMAIACLQRAVLGVALQPGRLDPAVALARHLNEAGESEAALAQLERLVAYDYSFQPARELRAEIAAEIREPQLAQTQATGETAPTPAQVEIVARQRYEIVNELGRGGMGVVYKARDTRLERDVAIKVLRTTSSDEVARLEQEAKAAATLNHPGIVTIYDFEAGFDGYFIAMEFVPGDPLDEILRGEPERIRADLLTILIRLADAVAYAHDNKVIHRDLKPGNILLTRDRDVKILDFGIAARLDTGTGAAPTVCGTPYYMAPEQIRGEAPNPATDLYAYGATSFHLATGRPPFSRGNVIEAHLSEPPPDPLTLAPDLDPTIAEIITRCLAKEPDARHPSAAAVRDALTAIAAPR